MGIENESAQIEMVAEDKPSDDSSPKPDPRKKFVEPEVSTPVDVLEATTFFQATGTGIH